MATTKKTTKRTTKKTNSRRPKDVQENDLRSDIVLLVILALAIILMISDFGMGGPIGQKISTVSFGVFGYLTFAFPAILFIGALFLISNRGNRLAYKKMFACILFFIFSCGLVQLLTEGYVLNENLMDYYQTCSSDRTGGGLVGGAICLFLVTAFGVVGAYVILAAVLLVCLVIITQRSFFGFIGMIFRRLGGSVQSGVEHHRQGAPERQKKAEERRAVKEARREERRQLALFEDEEEEKKTGFLEGTKLTLPELPDPEPEQASGKKKSGKKAKEKAASRMQSEEKSFFEEAPVSGDLDMLKIHTMEEPASLPFEEDFPEEYKEPPLSAQEEIPGMETVPEKQEEAPVRSAARNPRSSKEEIQDGIQNIQHEIDSKEKGEEKVYQYPPLSLLNKPGKSKGDSDEHLRKTAAKLQETLKNFGVNVTVTNASCGPTVTRYELHPEQGVKVSRIVSLSDDIKLNLATSDIRIEAPIPGKAAVGIEVPNKTNSPVMLRELLQSQEFQSSKSKLTFAAGKDIGGQPVIADIGKMPHLLIAGATGSGKSVCINTLIMSILYKASPDEVKMIMIDPKVVELSVYNGIPHLFIPVVTDPKKAAGALNWAVQEMTNRYNTFAEFSVRNLADYNRKVAKMRVPEGEERPAKMPQIVIIVDELADLMMVAPGEVEDSICRLAQLARAAGIHLVIATQRPSVNVITGVIKANMPSRIAFAVSSGVDSRTILDMVGAEKLLGKGDMLFYPQGYQKPARVQGAFVSDEEVSAVVEFLSQKNPATQYSKEIEQQVNTSSFSSAAGGSEEKDHYFVEAGKFIIDKDKASIGMLQRMFKIGFNRAARIMDQLADAGVVGPEEGTKPRKVLMTMEEFETYIEESL